MVNQSTLNEQILKYLSKAKLDNASDDRFYETFKQYDKDVFQSALFGLFFMDYAITKENAYNQWQLTEKGKNDVADLPKNMDKNIILDKRDIVMGMFFPNKERQNIQKSSVPAIVQLFNIDNEHNQLEVSEFYSIIRQFIVDDLVEEFKNDFYIPLKEMNTIFKAGGFKKYEAFKEAQTKETEEDKKLQRESIIASTKLSKSTKFIGILTIIALIVQSFLFYLQYSEMQKQNKLQILLYLNNQTKSKN